MDPTHPDYRAKKARPVWERHDGLDTNESWPYFKAYRDLTSGVRTLDRVRFHPSEDVRRPVDRTSVPTLETIHRWFREGQWSDRVKAFDEHMDEVLQDERELLARQGGAKLAAEQMRYLQTAQDLVTSELDKMLEQSRASDFTGFKPNEIARLMDVTTRLQRLVVGESTDNAEVRVDLSKLSLEDLEKMEELTKKAGGEE